MRPVLDIKLTLETVFSDNVCPICLGHCLSHGERRDEGRHRIQPANRCRGERDAFAGTGNLRRAPEPDSDRASAQGAPQRSSADRDRRQSIQASGGARNAPYHRPARRWVPHRYRQGRTGILSSVAHPTAPMPIIISSSPHNRAGSFFFLLAVSFPLNDRHNIRRNRSSKGRPIQKLIKVWQINMESRWGFSLFF